MEDDVRDLFRRSIREAMLRQRGAALDDALRALEWRDALAEERRDAISILFELQGETNASSSALELVVLDALGCRGTRLVLPALGRWQVPASASASDDRVVVDGVLLGPAAEAVVVAGDVAAVVATADLAVRDVHGVDPSLGLVVLHGEVPLGDATPVDWAAAVPLAQMATGHELVGASRRMLELARTHALDRIQFGQPIAMFQAVRHRLADTLVAIETADAMLDAAWLDGTPVSAAMAKALAGRGARLAARHCQQVLAGVGFTTEHDLHHFIRRVLVLDQLFGSSRALTRALGTTLLTNRQLPPLLPL